MGEALIVRRGGGNKPVGTPKIVYAPDVEKNQYCVYSQTKPSISADSFKFDAEEYWRYANGFMLNSDVCLIIATNITTKYVIASTMNMKTKTFYEKDKQIRESGGSTSIIHMVGKFIEKENGDILFFTGGHTNGLYVHTISVSENYAITLKQSTCLLTGWSGYYFDCVKLNQNRILAFHWDVESCDIDNPTKVSLIDTTNDTPSVIATINVQTGSEYKYYYKYTVYLVKMSENKVLIATEYSINSDPGLYGKVILINNDTLSIGTNTAILAFEADDHDRDQFLKKDANTLFVRRQTTCGLFNITDTTISLINSIDGSSVEGDTQWSSISSPDFEISMTLYDGCILGYIDNNLVDTNRFLGMHDIYNYGSDSIGHIRKIGDQYFAAVFYASANNASPYPIYYTFQEVYSDDTEIDGYAFPEGTGKGGLKTGNLNGHFSEIYI